MLAPDGPAKFIWLSNLGMSLHSRFEQFGDLVDLNKSVQVMEDAVLLTPHDHPYKATQLNNLGLSLQTCFDYPNHRGCCYAYSG